MAYKLLFNAASTSAGRIVSLAADLVLSASTAAKSCRVEVDFDINQAGLEHCILFSLTDYNYIRLYPTGIFRVGYNNQNNFNDAFDSSAQSLVVGQKNTISFDLNGTRKTAELRLNGVLIGSASNRWGTYRVKDVGLWPGASMLNGHIYEIRQYQDGVLIGRQSAENVSSGTVLPDLVGSYNMSQAGTWPSDDSEWVFYSSGGGIPPQELIATNAETRYQVIPGNVSVNQVIAAVDAETKYQVIPGNVSVNQVIAAVNAETKYQVIPGNVSVNQVIAAVNAETKYQVIPGDVSVNQVIAAVNAETKYQVIPGSIDQSGSQTLTADTIETLFETTTAGLSVNQVLAAVIVDTRFETVPGAIDQGGTQTLSASNIETFFDTVVTGLSVNQLLTSVTIETLFETVSADVVINQVMIAPSIETRFDTVSVGLSANQVLTSVDIETRFETTSGDFVTPPTIDPFKIKITVLPFGFTVRNTTPVFTISRG